MFEKKRGKRFLASVMALVMLLSLAPVGALAAENEGQPAENQAVAQSAVEGKDQQAVGDTKDTNENTPTAQPLEDFKPVVDNSDEEGSAEVVKPMESLINLDMGDRDGSSVATYSVSGPDTVKVGEEITLTCNNTFFWHTHNWKISNSNKKVELVGDTDKSTVRVKGLKEGTATISCGQDSMQINVTDPQYVIRFYVSGTGTKGLYTEQQKYSIADQPNSTFADAVESNPLTLYVSPGYAILTEYNDTAKNITTSSFKNVSVSGDAAVREWLTTYANDGVPTGLTDRGNVETIVEQVNVQYTAANDGYYKDKGITLPLLQTNYYNGFRFVGAHYVDSGESTIHVDVQLVKNTEYTVRYEPNGGAGNAYDDPGLYQKDDSVAVKGNMFTREGYEFAGWNTKADGSGTPYQRGSTITIKEANVTLYAQWKPNKYKVSYSFVSGTTGEELPTEVTNQLPAETQELNGSEVTAPTSFTSVEVKDANDVVIGTWSFESWDHEKQTVNGQNISFKGTWKYTDAKYQVSYSFVSGTTDKVLPDAVTNQLPAKTEELNGSEVTAPTSFTSVEVKDANDVVIGTWSFESWDHEKQTVNGQNISFKGTWKYTDAKYQVSYSFVSGTTDKVLPDAVTNQLPAKTEELNGSEVIAPTSFTSVEVKGANDVVIGTWNFERWDHEKQTVNGQNISFKGTWKYTDAPAPGEWKYTVNQHFINAKGEKTDRGTSVTVADTTVITLQDSIPDGMQQNQNFGDPAQNYVYIAKETTYQVNSEKKNASDNLDNGAVIDLYYYLDVIGEEKPDAPDGTPDCYQVTINYVTDNTGRGKITGLTTEVKTIRDESNNPVKTGKVTATGSTAEATGSRNYFSNWANDAGLPTSSTAKLGKQTFNAAGGKTYTFTANFDRSSGGGGGGSRPTVTIPDDVPTGLNGKDHYAYIIGYGNNDVRPQNNITRAEVATIFFRLLTDETREANMTKSNGYNDVKDGDWFCCAVSTLSKMGIIKGYEDGSFKPNDPISRAEFAAIAARFDPDGDKTPASFSDVTSHWAKDEISIAANHGWIKGYEDGSFKPDQKITRAETMTLVNRVLNRLPETKDDLHKDMKTWVDNMDETAWYYLAVQEATNSHYFKNKTGTKFEQWTDLRDTRDWSELEK